MVIVLPVASGTTFVVTDPARAGAALAGHGLRLGARRVVARVRVDTFGRDLRAAGWTVEHHRRTGEPARLVVHRLGVASWSVPLAEPPRRAADLPPGPLTAGLVQVLGVRALLTVAGYRATARPAWASPLTAVPPVAEVLHGVVSGGGGRWDGVVEVAPAAAWPADLRPTRRALRDDLRTQGDTRRRGDLFDLLERLEPSLSPTRPAPPRPPTPRQPAIDGFAAGLAEQAAVLAATWPGTLADLDIEFLHELRVAVRRARALLVHGRGVLPDEPRRGFARELAWLNRLTGPTRDLDVLAESWATFAAGLPVTDGAAVDVVRQDMTVHRMAARDEMVLHLAGQRASRLVTDLARWAADGCPGEQADAAHRPLGTVVARRLRAAHRRIVEHGRTIDESSGAERLHELRKDAKRARSIFDVFGPVFPADDAARFVRVLRRLQDELGRHQDAAVHAARIEELAGRLTDPAARAAALGMAAARHADCLAARAEFATRFAAFDRPRVARLVDRMADRLTP